MNKQCNVWELTKSLNRSYSMDSENNRVVANLNLEDKINNSNTWNHLTACKQMSPVSFLKVAFKLST